MPYLLFHPRQKARPDPSLSLELCLLVNDKKIRWHTLAVAERKFIKIAGQLIEFL
jgi:hypothetical protein